MRKELQTRQNFDLELFKNMIENSPIGILINEMEQFYYINSYFAELFGYENKSELLDKTMEAIFPERMREFQKKKGEKRRTGFYEVQDYESIGLRKDGTEFPVRIIVSEVKLGVKSYYISYFQDISNSKHNEKILKSSMELYQKLFNSAPHGIVVIQDATIKHVNEQFIRMLGYQYDHELINKSIDIINPPELQEMMFQRSLRRQQGYDEPQSYVSEVLHKFGRRLPISIKVELIEIESRPASLAHVEDLSVLRETEKELENKTQQLYRAQKMESIARISGGIAHDVNNMLTAILGYTNLLESENLSNSEQTSYIGDIRSIVKKSADLTRRLLTFSKQRVNRPEILDLNESIRNVSQIIEQVTSPNIILNFELNDLEDGIYMDLGQLEQILMNLVINAKDAMPNGGTLTVKTSNCDKGSHTKDEISVLWSDARFLPRIMLEIIDTGIGMTSQEIEKIFDPFYTTKSNGTGLGLSTVYGIVEENQGAITLLSEPGKGTNFRICFLETSKIEKPQKGLTQKLIPKEIRFNTKKILLVDDHVDVRKILSMYLSSKGYDVINKENPLEVLEMPENLIQEVDILVTDIVMPHMDGIELIRKIRSIHPDIQILIMTGYHQHIEIAQKLNLENYSVMEKPFGPPDLEAKISSLISDSLSE